MKILTMLLVCGSFFINTKAFNQYGVSEIPPSAPANEISKSEDGLIFVDFKPQFEGNIRLFLGSNIRYPQEAIENYIEGIVDVEFIVTTTGEVENIKILRSIGYGCDEEAIRVIRLTDKKWKPGIYNDEKVNCKMRIPIRFKLM